MSEQPVPVLDLEKDFGEIIGDPVEKYEQNFARFDALGKFVGYAPDFYRRVPPEKKVNLEAERAREKIEQARRQQEQFDGEAAALNRSSQTIGASASQPSSLMEASRENAAARRADQLADD